jgi:hypothetical protein
MFPEEMKEEKEQISLFQRFKNIEDNKQLLPSTQSFEKTGKSRTTAPIITGITTASVSSSTSTSGKLPPVKAPPSPSSGIRPPSPPIIRTTNLHSPSSRPLFTKTSTVTQPNSSSVKPMIQLPGTILGGGGGGGGGSGGGGGGGGWNAVVFKAGSTSTQAFSSSHVTLSLTSLTETSLFTSSLITLSGGENCEVGLAVSTSGLNNVDELIKSEKKTEQEEYIYIYCVCMFVYMYVCVCI